MFTLLFVHGTGVRGEAFDTSFAAVKEQVAFHLKPRQVDVQACRWGDQVGARLHQDGASVPSYEQRPGQAAPDDSAKASELRWSLLYDDPLYELRSYAALSLESDLVGSTHSPLQTPADEEVLRRLDQLQPSAGGVARSGHFASQLLPQVRALLLADGVLANALQCPAMDALARSRPVLARAFVGAWMQAARRQHLPELDGELRDSLYEDAVNVLGGSTMGLLDEFIGALGGLASRVATPLMRAKRTEISDGSFAAVNDILLYQTKHGGEAIRDFIAKRIEACTQAGRGPVWLLAHSLGGIACLELLVLRPDLQVAGLITCGSQAPFLYEADALGALRQGQALPAHFPKHWLNVFDLNDMLSYVGAGVFPGRVTDHEVHSRQPFPQSHSAYWTHAPLWQRMKTFIP